MGVRLDGYLCPHCLTPTHSTSTQQVSIHSWMDKQWTVLPSTNMRTSMCTFTSSPSWCTERRPAATGWWAPALQGKEIRRRMISCWLCQRQTPLVSLYSIKLPMLEKSLEIKCCGRGGMVVRVSLHAAPLPRPPPPTPPNPNQFPQYFVPMLNDWTYEEWGDEALDDKYTCVYVVKSCYHLSHWKLLLILLL